MSGGPSNPRRVKFTYNAANEDVTIVFDASINEQHGGQATVTEHPVEKGPNVTDNVRPMPRKLTLEAFVTNTPVYKDVLGPTQVSAGTLRDTASKTATLSSGTDTSVPGANSLTFPEEFNRVADVYNNLVIAYQAAALIHVETTLQNYDNMVIVNLAVPRNVQSSNAVSITIDLQEIVLVETSLSPTLAPKHVKTNRGPKAAKPVDPPAKEEKARSFAKSLAQSLGLVK